jgi:hypothetical protein
MNNLKEQRIKTLENDLTKLFNKMTEERNVQDEFIAYTTNFNEDGWESIREEDLPNYRTYFKLTSSFISLFRTYFDLLPYDNDVTNYTKFTSYNINNEINKIHNDMEFYLDKNLFNQYRTLNNIYENLIKLSQRLHLPELTITEMVYYRDINHLMNFTKKDNNTSNNITNENNRINLKDFDYMGEKIFKQEKIKLDKNKIGIVKYQPITIGDNEQVYGWIYKNNEWIRFDFNDKAFIINDSEPNETVSVMYYYFDKDAKVVTLNANDII